MQPSRREVMRTGLAGLGAIVAGTPSFASATACEQFSFHHDHILGTALDLWVTATDRKAAEQAEGIALDEIERLRCIFSTYDNESELSRLNRANDAVWASDELIDVLRQYETWTQLTQGAFSAQLGELIARQQHGINVPSTQLADMVGEIQHSGWRIEGSLVTRFSGQQLNLNSAAKGFILQNAANRVRNAIPAASSLVLNLGGDLIGFGSSFLVAVQNPHRPEENSRPLTVLRLHDVSVATSGGYQRFANIDGERHSHLIDPASGRSADAIAGATVVAPDSVTANILATTICVLSHEEGLRLIAETPGTSCLIVRANGECLRSAGFAALELPISADTPEEKQEAPKTGDAWPADYRVAIHIELPTIAGGKYRRPYVAVWIENSGGKSVRSVTVWGNDRKWLKDLSIWWKFVKDDQTLVRAVTRATRSPGKYEVVWDGKDDKGEALPKGTYTIKVEVHREHGKHLTQIGKLECGDKPVKITLEKNAETGTTTIDFGKKK